MAVAAITQGFFAIVACSTAEIMNTTRLDTTFIAMISVVLAKAESTKIALLVALALAIAAIAGRESTAGSTIFEVTTHALVAFHLGASRALATMRAKAVLVAITSAKFVSADATEKGSGLGGNRELVVAVVLRVHNKDGILALGAFPLSDDT
jgi:hypothetical protein